MKKLYKNNFTVLISSLAISSTLIACTPSKTNDEQIKREIITQTLKQTKNEADKVIKKGEELTKELKERKKDKEIEEFITLFRQEISELGNIAKDKWNSEETQEKLNNIKQKSKDLFNFVFNGKEINGIKFKDLSDNGKEIAQNGLHELDYYIELMIPNYKDRLKDWTVDTGADAVELFGTIKNIYQNYQEDVMEEYSSRNEKSK